MPEVSKLGVGWSGLLEQLTECIKAWRPPLLKREIDSSRLLAAYLRERLPPDSHVETEYRHAGETIDVCVRYSGIVSNDEIVLEVKRRLTRKTELSRLVGQVMGLGPEKNKILLVLIGSCDVELVGRFRAQLQKHIAHGPLIVDVPTLRIVEIPEAIVM
jgi:hypothetical protein